MRGTGYFGTRTKIVCTIGPATGSSVVIEQLIKAGMNVARLNLSHGTHSEHARYVALIREKSASLGVPVAIMMDLPGPKYRVGELREEKVTLNRGAHVVLATKPAEGSRSVIPVNLPTLPNDAKVGDTVFLDDGAMQLKVTGIADAEVKCRVIVGGILTSGRGIAVPGMHPSSPFITEQIREHLSFVAKQQPDYIALSFVSQPSDVTQVRDILRQKKLDMPIIAKIERREAIDKFDAILDVSDGIMVARGDLGVDIPLERIPLEQKRIIRKCNFAAKPVITATQMLESMVNSPRPTRAETTDVANAIFDGTDAIMLSAETSVGKYPIRAAKMMSLIARETEAELPYKAMLAEKALNAGSQVDDAISYNACYAAQQLNASAIVAFTESGSTAHRVSKYRSEVPTIAITPSETVLRRLLLCWGIQPFQIPRLSSVDEFFKVASKLVKDLGLAKKNGLIVITGGVPVGIPGSTNLLKVERIS